MSGETGLRIAGAKSAFRSEKYMKRNQGELTDEETRGTTRQGSQRSHCELKGGTRNGTFTNRTTGDRSLSGHAVSVTPTSPGP